MSKNYVSFECTHLAEADRSDPDERQAIAYADIDGYTADENEEGTVICRVWLLPGKDSIYSRFLTDWHHNGYRTNDSVKECIKAAKEQLDDYKDVLVDKLLRKVHERYKMNWLMENGFTIDWLLDQIQRRMEHGDTVQRSFAYFEEDCQTGSSRIYSTDCYRGKLYDDIDSFESGQWEDEEAIKPFLKPGEYLLWKNRK